MVKARHEAHVAVGIAHYHEGGIGDVERSLVVACSSLLGAEVLQRHCA